MELEEIITQIYKSQKDFSKKTKAVEGSIYFMDSSKKGIESSSYKSDAFEGSIIFKDSFKKEISKTYDLGDKLENRFDNNFKFINKSEIGMPKESDLVKYETNRNAEILYDSNTKKLIRSLTLGYIEFLDYKAKPGEVVTLDNVVPLLRNFLISVLSDEALFDAVKGIGPGVPRNIFAEGPALLKTLEAAYIAHFNKFLGRMGDTFRFVEYLSTHKFVGIDAGQDGPKPLVQRVGGLITPGMTEAYTHFSLPFSEKMKDEERFYGGLRLKGLEGLTAGLYEVSTILADPRARKEVSKTLGDIERERNLSLEARLDNGPVEVDVLVVGAGTHTSNFISTLKTLRPDLVIGVVDKYPEAGYLWSNRGWIVQNNTNGPASLNGNLPREGGDLFPTGYFGAVRVPMVSHGRWPKGDDVGIALRWNLNLFSDQMLLGYEVSSVAFYDKKRNKHLAKVKNMADGEERLIQANYVIVTGATKSLNPFEEDGVITDLKAHNIWNEEIAKSRKGEDALVFDYDLFSARINTHAGRREFLDDKADGNPKKISVAGSGDGGNTVVGFLLEQSGFYEGRIAQIGGKRPDIVWWGQDALTREQYAKKSRSVYAQVCAGYANGKIIPDPRKIGSIARQGKGLVIFPEGSQKSSEGRYSDRLVFAGGYRPVEDMEMFGDLGFKGRSTLFDRESRGVASYIPKTKIYFIGPSSGLPLEEAGRDVLDIYNKIGIKQNQVANWWRGPQSIRAAITLASQIEPSYLRKQQIK